MFLHASVIEYTPFYWGYFYSKLVQKMMDKNLRNFFSAHCLALMTLVKELTDFSMTFCVSLSDIYVI
jgi:hypothetical protein